MFFLRVLLQPARLLCLQTHIRRPPRLQHFTPAARVETGFLTSCQFCSVVEQQHRLDRVGEEESDDETEAQEPDGVVAEEDSLGRDGDRAAEQHHGAAICEVEEGEVEDDVGCLGVAEQVPPVPAQAGHPPPGAEPLEEAPRPPRVVPVEVLDKAGEDPGGHTSLQVLVLVLRVLGQHLVESRYLYFSTTLANHGRQVYCCLFVKCQ